MQEYINKVNKVGDIIPGWLKILPIGTLLVITLSTFSFKKQEVIKQEIVDILTTSKEVKTIDKWVMDIQNINEGINQLKNSLEKNPDDIEILDLIKKRSDYLSDLLPSKQNTNKSLKEYEFLIEHLSKRIQLHQSFSSETKDEKLKKNLEELYAKVLSNYIGLISDIKNKDIPLEKAENAFKKSKNIKEKYGSSIETLCINMSNVYITYAGFDTLKSSIYYNNALILLAKITSDDMAKNNIAVATSELTKDNDNITDIYQTLTPIDEFKRSIDQDSIITKDFSKKFALDDIKKIYHAIIMMDTYLRFQERGVKDQKIKDYKFYSNKEKLEEMLCKISYSFETLEKDIEKIKTQQEREQLIYLIMMGLLLVGLGFAVYYIREQKQKQKIEQEKNEELENQNQVIENLAAQLERELQEKQRQEAHFKHHGLKGISNSQSGLLNLYEEEMLSPEDFINKISKLIRELEDYSMTLSHLDNLEISNKEVQGKDYTAKSTNRNYENILELLQKTNNPCIYNINNQVKEEITTNIPINYINYAVYCLVDNAYKFLANGNVIDSKKDKKIIITTSIIEKNIVIKVEDDGIGTIFSLKDIENKARQYDSGMSATGLKGAANTRGGVGLLYVKTLCEKYGGTFTLDSRLGIGTTVTISLPVTVVADQ